MQEIKPSITYTFNFLELIKFLIKWKKHLTFITLGAVFLSYGVTFFITPEYKSKAVFYPGTVNSTSFALFYSIKERAQDALAYGDEEYVEQYLQLAQSNQLKEKIANQFNLIDHYEIKASDTKKYAKLYNKMDDNIQVSRTSYNSLEVSVLDENPELAAQIANAIMFGTDSLKKLSQRAVALQAVKIIEHEYNAKLALTDSLNEASKKLGDIGIYNVEEQSKGLSELIGKGTNNSFTEKERQNLGQHVGSSISLAEQIRFEAEQLTDLRKKLSQAKLDLDGGLSNIFVVDYAKPNYDKASPLRLITAILAGLIAFFMSSIVIISLERYQHIRQQLSAE